MNESNWDDDLPLWDPQQEHLWMLKSLRILYTRNFGKRQGTSAFDSSRRALEHVLNVEDSRDKQARDLENIAPTELIRMLRARR